MYIQQEVLGETESFLITWRASVWACGWLWQPLEGGWWRENAAPDLRRLTESSSQCLLLYQLRNSYIHRNTHTIIFEYICGWISSNKELHRCVCTIQCSLDVRRDVVDLRAVLICYNHSFSCSCISSQNHTILKVV